MADQGNEGIFSPFLRDQRIKAVSHLLIGKVLDVGCGTGALADIIPATLYCGVDIDELSLQLAKKLHLNHNFQFVLPPIEEKFNTIVASAVIEHVPNPVSFLYELAQRLGDSTNDSIILTTPHPSMDWIHTLGSRIGFFSRHANEEHNELLNNSRLAEIATKCNLKIKKYKRFLLGANQLVVLEKI